MKTPTPELLEHEALDLVDQLLAAARDLGAEHCDVSTGKGASVGVSVREQEIEELSRSSSRACGVRVIHNGKVGFTAWADVPHSKTECEEMVRTALSLASMSTASEHNILPTTNVVLGNELSQTIKNLDKWDPEVAKLSSEWALQTALGLERDILKLDGIAMSNHVGASLSYGTFALGSTNGFRGAYSGTSSSLAGGALVEDADNKKRTGMWWSAHRFKDQLEDIHYVAQQAALKAKEKLGARTVDSAQVPVIFDPMMAKGFFGAAVGALNGESVAKKASFLWDKRDTQILTSGIRIYENPLMPRGFGSTPFDGEGVQTIAQDIINDEGMIQTWLHDAQSAHRLGEAPTGHARRGSSGLPGPGYSNLEVLGGQGDLESIIGATQKGLLVTSLMGHSPDMITGDYSRGASGFWIENGERAFPVEEITIAGTMQDMMMNIDMVGSDLDRRGAFRRPQYESLSMSVSGK